MKSCLYDCKSRLFSDNQPLFDEDTSFLTDFISSDIWYQGDYDEEDFVGLNYKVIECLAVKPKYYENKGKTLAKKDLA